MPPMSPRSGLIGVLVAVCACGKSDPNAGDAGIDGTGPALCENLGLSCSDAITLANCTELGVEPETSNCPWGCKDTGGAHCGALSPTGGALTAADLADDPSIVSAEISGTIDGNTGTISNVRGAGTGVVDGIGYELRGDIAVFRFASLHVAGALALVGDHPIALVAPGPIIVDGVIDAQGSCTGLTAVAGGLAGGAAGSPGSNGAAAGAGAHDSASGGGGAGQGGNGGMGGAGIGQLATAGGSPSGSDTIDVLVGGGGGAGGGGTDGGVGGGGGGALQLASNSSLLFGPSGGINAGGCGGKDNLDGGGGGGAGGTILIEAPSVLVSAGSVLAVNGGGGAAGSSCGSRPGTPGALGDAPAVGGAGCATTGGAGGSGGAAMALDGSNGTTSPNGGGGGGAVGRIRFETRVGRVTLDSGAVLSPPLVDGSTSTHAAATVN